MIQDLHSHTYYSFCGADTPEEVVETAIRGGIELLGITDHSYGIGDGSHFIHRNLPAEIGSRNHLYENMEFLDKP